MKKFKIRKGDRVVVTTGKDQGKQPTEQAGEEGGYCPQQAPHLAQRCQVDVAYGDFHGVSLPVPPVAGEAWAARRASPSLVTMDSEAP